LDEKGSFQHFSRLLSAGKAQGFLLSSLSHFLQLLTHRKGLQLVVVAVAVAEMKADQKKGLSTSWYTKERERERSHECVG